MGSGAITSIAAAIVAWCSAAAAALPAHAQVPHEFYCKRQLRMIVGHIRWGARRSKS
jgi:hypothetical protein